MPLKSEMQAFNFIVQLIRKVYQKYTEIGQFGGLCKISQPTAFFPTLDSVKIDFTFF